MTTYAIFAPLHCWLGYIAAGWRLPEPIVEPMLGGHGAYSVLLVMDDAP